MKLKNISDSKWLIGPGRTILPGESFETNIPIHLTYPSEFLMIEENEIVAEEKVTEKAPEKSKRQRKQ